MRKLPTIRYRAQSPLLFWGVLALLGAVLYAGLLATFFSLETNMRENSNDILIYRAAGEAILRGQVPYQDFFIEYPPGSLPVFVPPALFSSTTTGYALAFAHEMALVLVATMLVTALAARRLGAGGMWLLAAPVFVAGALLLHPIATTRYDAVVALTFALAALCAAAGGRYLALGYASLGLGAAAKLVPALAILPMALFGKRNGSGWLRGVVPGFAIFSAILALFFAPAYLLGGERFVESFLYHAERGLQIESLPSSALMALGWLQGIEFEYGAWEVRGRGVEFLSSLSLPVTAALLLITIVVMYRDWRSGQAGPGRFPRYAAALILAFMLGSKVLSPQYMLWLLPLVPLAAGGWWAVGIAAMFLTACWTTTQIFPAYYGDLLSFEPFAVNILVARNLLLVMLWALMLFLPAEANPGKEKA